MLIAYKEYKREFTYFYSISQGFGEAFKRLEMRYFYLKILLIFKK